MKRFFAALLTNATVWLIPAALASTGIEAGALTGLTGFGLLSALGGIVARRRARQNR